MLSGKKVVITGCHRGIGRATVETFAQNGANIWACVRTHDNVFEADMARLAEETGVWIKLIYFDCMNEEQIKEGVREIMKDKQPVHGLVNIAGITHNALFHMTTMDAFHKVFQIDFFSQMLVSQLVTKLMIRAGGGSVVNVASIYGLDGNVGQIAYSAAKGALVAATRTMAKELAEKGIRVNAVAPGAINTAMTQALTEEQRAKLLAPCELKRIGEPQEVANAIAFLISDRASYITGQVIRIDGGIG